jgi:putative membrane protein
MQRFNQGYFESLTRAVEQAETKTAAEVVVAVRPQSGRYADVDYLFGGLVALVGLLFIVFNPWTWHPANLLPVEMAVLFAIGTLGCSVSPPLRRLLTTGKRRQSQLREAAAALFVEEGVANTRARTGVLVYVSLLERQVEVIPDVGITGHVQPDVWSHCLFELKKIGSAPDAAQALLDGIRRLGDVLSQDLPAGEDNPDELPNRPRTQE